MQSSTLLSETQTSQAPLPGKSATAAENAAAGRSVMRAIVQSSYGSADTLALQTVDRPTIGAKEVLIEVHAAGLDSGTVHLMTGTPYLIRILGFGLTKPKQATPGFDVAGRVIAIGSGVTRFVVGDEVFGICRSGSFAEYAAASEDKLVHKPAGVSFEQAAVTAISGITALQALTEIGRLQSGQRVLVIGASGGVGSFAVQLAKSMGAKVSGVASASKVDLVRALGADEAFDYATHDFTSGESRYDLIVDIGGLTRISSLRRVLTSRGTLALVGGDGGNRLTGGLGRQIGASLLSAFVSQRLRMFIAAEDHSRMQRLAELIASGAVTPSIGQRFGLDDAPQAVRQFEAGKVRGKSVIIVRS